MKTLQSLKEQYPSSHAVAIAHGVSPTQFARLLSKGAVYNESGQVFIPSTTKLNGEVK